MYGSLLMGSETEHRLAVPLVQYCDSSGSLCPLEFESMVRLVFATLSATVVCGLVGWSWSRTDGLTHVLPFPADSGQTGD